MKKEERKRYANRLKAAKFSAIILLLIQIGFIFVYKLMWDIENNLGLVQNIFLYLTPLLILFSFFLYWGLAAIARKEKLKSLEIIFWIVFGFSVISNLFNLLIFNNYGNLPLAEWASFIIFVTAMTYIIFGLSFFQLQNKFGNIVKGAAIPNILIGIMFLGTSFITISFLSRAIIDITFLILEVIVFISVIIIFNGAIKSN
jgi:hypothetical protein